MRLIRFLADSTTVTNKLPSKALRLLETHPKTFLAGGFIRDCLHGKTPNDIDLFGPIEDCPFTGMTVNMVRGVATVGLDDEHPIQWIPKTAGSSLEDTIASVLENFDYVCNQVAWSPVTEDILCADTNAIYNSSLILTDATKQATLTYEQWVCDLKRLLRLSAKGYVIPSDTLAFLVSRIFGKDSPTDTTDVDQDSLHIGIRKALNTESNMPFYPETIDDFQPTKLNLLASDYERSGRQAVRITQESNNESDWSTMAFNPSPTTGPTVYGWESPVLGPTEAGWPPTVAGISEARDPISNAARETFADAIRAFRVRNQR